MRELIKLRTGRWETLVDITPQVRDLVRRSGVSNGLVAVYAQGSTAAIMIQENWDDSVQRDVVELLRRLIPQADPAGCGSTMSRMETAMRTSSPVWWDRRRPSP